MDRIVVFKENGIIKTTNEKNYNARIRDGLKITKWDNFTSFEQFKEYWNKTGYGRRLLLNCLFIED